MTEKEFCFAFKEYGWNVKKDEVGDLYGRIDLEDRILQIIPTLRKATGHYRVSCMPSISTKMFTHVTGEIIGELEDYTPLIRRNEIVSKIENIDQLNVESISNEVIAWGKSQDIEQGLEAYRNLPTDAKGARPLWHLAALAIAGNLDRLTGYQESFKRGDRLDFVPYITVEMIDRAVLIAKKNSGRE